MSEDTQGIRKLRRGYGLRHRVGEAAHSDIRDRTDERDSGNPVKRVHFNNTRSLALFFEDNWSQGEEDETRITYLAFKGDFMKLNKEPVSVLYEAAANPADHKAIAGVKEGLGRGYSKD